MDSVPYGGKYDEFYGVIAVPEILRSVKDLNTTSSYGNLREVIPRSRY